MVEFLLLDINFLTSVLPEGSSTDKPSAAMDPARIWPSGVPQSASIIGSALAVYATLIKLNVNPRIKVLSALSAAAITTGNVIYHSALENSLGFNRFMFGLTKYNNQGNTWPSVEVEAMKVSEETISKFAEEYMKKKIDETVLAKVKEVLDSQSKSFISDIPDFFSNLEVSKLADFFFNVVFTILKPVSATGFFEYLVGQHIIILISLLIIGVFTSILFIIFLVNLTIFINREYLINRFSNKWIRFYVTFQTRLIKYSLM